MKKNIISILLILISLSLQAQIVFIDNDMQEAYRQSINSNKIIFVDAYTDWCGPCNAMKQTTFQNRTVGDYFNQAYICVKMNMDLPEGRNFANRYGVNAYPTLLFLHSKDSIVAKSVGMLGEKQLLDFGQSVNTNQIIFDFINNSNTPVAGSSIQIPNNDGRFTIGVKGQRLMYGYPYPNSTSHFILKVDNDFASNNSSFGGIDMSYSDFQTILPKSKIKRFFNKLFKRKEKRKKFTFKNDEPEATYLIDTLIVTLGEATVVSEIDFDFSSTTVKQTLTPVDVNLEKVPLDSFGRYIQVKYEVKNNSNKNKKIGLVMFFDTMIDDNDACMIDAYNEGEEVKKKVSRKRRNEMDKEKRFLNSEMPDRLLAYHDSQKLSEGLTGDFLISKKDATKPDELFIGSWSYLYCIQWKPKNGGRKYKDSGVFFKWDENTIQPGETKTFITYYGLYNPGELEVIPANSNIYGRDKEGVKIVPDEYEFIATPQSIFKGEEITLTWDNTNLRNAEIEITEMNYDNDVSQNKKTIKTNAENIGKMTLVPENSKIYQMTFETNGKIIKTINATVKVTPRILPTQIELNGQFNFGYNDVPILYGYPHKLANSFFILRLENKAFTNNINKPAGYTYRTSVVLKYPDEDINLTKLYDTISGIATEQSIFKAENIDGDNDFNYYNIQYKFSNLSDKEIKIDEFSLFNDYNLAGYDNCVIKNNKTKIAQTTLFTKNEIPEELNIEAGKNQKISILHGKNGHLKPISIIVGHWQKIINNPTKNEFEKIKYNDYNALKQTWKFTINPADSVILGYTIKVPKGKELLYNYNNNKVLETLEIFFETGKHKISTEEEAKIDKLLTEQDYKFINIISSADLNGSGEKNYNFSIKRSNTIKEYLIKKGVDENIIVIKNNGEVFSNQNEDNEDNILKLDRKVEIILYK